MKQSNTVSIEKTCKCGWAHKEIPAGHTITAEGYWFQCQSPTCDSTLFIRARKLSFFQFRAHAIAFVEAVKADMITQMESDLLEETRGAA